jgi:hypothetical protein
MRRLLVALSLLGLASVVVCAAAVWFAARPPITRFVVPGAQDVRIHEIGLGQRLITYQAAGGRYAWYFTIASQLEASGWIPPDKWGPPSQINTYTHVSPLWIGFLWEQVELHGEPNQARITIHRWITVPWRQYIVMSMRDPRSLPLALEL